MNQSSKPERLYVIGNGFDLWHGIPSKFSDFKRYVAIHDPRIVEEVETYLPAGDEWGQLEQALAEMDVDALVDNLGQFMPSYGADDWSDAGHHDFQYEVESCVDRLSVGLKGQFTNWVKGLPIPGRADLKRALTTLDPNALYLSFNYTPTLSKIYGIDPQRVCFIHGSAALQDDELILGHAWNPSSRPSLNSRDDVEDMDVRLYEANQIIDDYFSSTFKQSDKIIRRHIDFFNNLSNVEQVIILGHSLSDVDAAYFTALLTVPALTVANWKFACRDLSEWPEKLLMLKTLGVSSHKASPISWENI